MSRSATHDVLARAAATTGELVGDAGRPLVDVELRRCGPALARHVRHTDEPWLLLPVMHGHDERPQWGCVLALHDRAVLGWSPDLRADGVQTAVVPYDTVRTVAVTRSAAGSAPEATVVVRAEQTWRFGVPDVFLTAPADVPAALAEAFRRAEVT